MLNPWNIEALIQLENETKKKLNTIFQLRLHESIIKLRNEILNDKSNKNYQINQKYITSRGNWYHTSWKGDIQKSGGIATNIGVHFFDMLIWIFGEVQISKVLEHNATSASGILDLKRARVNWFLSIDENNLPDSVKVLGKKTFRSLDIDGTDFEFSDGFTELHTQ